MSIKQFPGGVITKSPTAPTTAAAKGIWTLGQAADFVKQGIWPRSPGAPTIGTATAVTFSTATVTFTAPTDLGTGAVTFTATSSPAGGSGTGTSPITVTGLSALTSYTFTVTASTPGGTSPASAASNSVTTTAEPAPTVIGQAYGGGYYAGQIGVSSVATHYLVVGPLSTAQSQLKWKNVNTATVGADSDIDGPQNTTDMVADGNSTVYPCAHFCNDLSTGGKTDWYMPAKNELEVCYYNLKPTVNSNDTSSGINLNAIPARASNYTSGTPPTTSATAFLLGGVEGFLNAMYWSSTEKSASGGWSQYFINGNQNYSPNKTQSYRVRAVRRVAV
tara:strand:+ start:1416 stop:2414 length:999 start_codon:yes stop_codon:yes gene_type:complete